MEGAARQLAAIAQITGYVFSIRDAMALSNFVCRFFCGNTGLYENHLYVDGFFRSHPQGICRGGRQPSGLCASDAQSPKREPLHNKTITAVYRRRRQAPAASVFRIVAPLLCRTADLPLSARSPDRSAAYYHDAFRHIFQGARNGLSR